VVAHRGWLELAAAALDVLRRRSIGALVPSAAPCHRA
jgi:hypothetical protein